MKRNQMIRALRDPKYRRRLSADQKARMIAHPSGSALAKDADLSSVTGGCGPKFTVGCGVTAYNSTILCSACGNEMCGA